MTLTAEKKAFEKKIKELLPYIATKNALPIIECVKIDTLDSETIALSAYDMQMGIRNTLSGVKIDEGGSWCIPAKKMLDIISAFEDGEFTLSVSSKGVVKVTQEKTEFKLHAMEGELFPNFPELNFEDGYDVSAENLKRCINIVECAVAHNSNQAALNGVLFSKESSTWTLYSCDSYSVAKAILSNNAGEGEENFIVLGDFLEAIKKIKVEGSVKFKAFNRHIVVKISDEMSVFSLLIKEKFPDIKRFINDEGKTVVRIDADSLKKTLERASIFEEKNGKVATVILSIAEGKIVLKNTTLSGTYEDTVECNIEGDSLRIGFDVTKIEGMISRVNSERVKIIFTNSVSPAQIIPEEGSEYRYVLLPMRIREE